ncbi:hypothetical protein [Streptomyces sp. NPDC052292]|uniref:hypothetical protein n=1 Tax=Streptomyces sp. NPDC052292 TaxID=3155053 RepID=UPI00341BB24D
MTVEDTSGRDADHIPLAFPQDPFHDAHHQSVAVIGSSMAARLGTLSTQSALFIGNTAFTVVGIFDDTKRKALRNAVSSEWTPVLDPATLAAAPALGLATGLLVGLYPSWRASRIQPVEALRH